MSVRCKVRRRQGEGEERSWKTVRHKIEAKVKLKIKK
jgi:hypothetical protein